MTERALYGMVQQAWTAIPAPPEEDMSRMEWGWGEAAARAFTNVAPIDVNIKSPGFHAATPLLGLPPRAAAAYFGTYLLSLLEGLEFQRVVGFFDDILTRAHTLTCLTNQNFWNKVIRKHLPPECQRAAEAVALHLASNPKGLYLDQKQVDTLRELATPPKA